jgi:flagellar biosynthetic protein FliR
MSAALGLAWMMVFLRSLGVILQLPVLAGRALPVMVRVGLCACLATIFAGLVRTAPVPATLGGIGVAAGAEVMLGLLLGFITRLTFEAVDMAGRVIASEIGLTATPGLGVPEPAHEPVAALVGAFAVICFFLLRGQEMLLSAFAHSFALAPAGAVQLSVATPDTLVRATGHALEIGVRLAAPFIGMNFLVTLAFSVLGRAAPRMNVFVLAFPIRTFAGLGLLATSGALFVRYVYVEFGDAPIRMLQVLAPR